MARPALRRGPTPVAELIAAKLQARLCPKWGGRVEPPMPREARSAFVSYLEAIERLTTASVDHGNLRGAPDALTDAVVAVTAAHEALRRAWVDGRLAQAARARATRAGRSGALNMQLTTAAQQLLQQIPAGTTQRAAP